MSARGSLVAILLIGLVAAAVFVYPRFEGEAPQIEVVPELRLGQVSQTLTIELSDAGSGLRSLDVRLQTAGGTKSLLERAFPGSPSTGGAPGTDRATIELPIDVAELRLPDGPATLTLTLRDWSLRDGFSGNRTDQTVQIEVDTRPPAIAVESGLTYVYRGGAAAAVYKIDADTVRDGIQVGDAFFRGYPLPAQLKSEPDSRQRRIALFAIPVEASENPSVRVVATDLAGNESNTSFPARILERRFPDANIALSRSFLDRVAVPLAESNGMGGADPVVAFQQVNRDLRARNESRIREVVAASGPTAQWSNAFSQMANSKVTSRFAELRSYTIDGKQVSTARHYGFDLASTSAAPITAANDGTVLFADELGIYGQCVIVDHGLGLTSLYAHLSGIDVAEGQRVTKGERLGRSGATGLAGGDHLHFGILLGDSYVDPMEWWDPRWVQSHITARLGP